jgi:hypothetical protein
VEKVNVVLATPIKKLKEIPPYVAHVPFPKEHAKIYYDSSTCRTKGRQRRKPAKKYKKQKRLKN